ncbi:hypothetical protein [Novipirellula maiorica]|nr:hypothetical protein [Rhodopirellula maiorica]
MAQKNRRVENARTEEEREELRNEDPVTGEAGAHPVGTGLGAALGGAATGAAAGAVAGPVGTVAGAVIGGVAGGLAGKAVAEKIDPTVEVAYWRTEHQNRDYYNDQYSYDDYAPAYQAGWESFDPDVNEDWADRERIARQRWEEEGGAPLMPWDDARPAAEDAYARVQNRTVNKPR